ASLDVPAVLQAFHRPALIMHARHDELIDPSHAERLAAWCAGPVRLQVFPEGGHNDIMFVNSRQYFALLRVFLESLQ
ncbi:MAG TPA: alpha/beta fold hydrolase, partial [Desulfuromonadales bacterium]|nr:alpha/beta fold hydrolase [Desulfuromonadales bacterium]